VIHPIWPWAIGKKRNFRGHWTRRAMIRAANRYDWPAFKASYVDEKGKEITVFFWSKKYGYTLRKELF